MSNDLRTVPDGFGDPRGSDLLQGEAVGQPAIEGTPRRTDRAVEAAARGVVHGANSGRTESDSVVSPGYKRGYRFVVPGVPVGKGRPRATTASGRVRMFTPKKSLSYESDAAKAGSDALQGHPPIAGPVFMRLIINVPIPKSVSKRDRAAMLNGDIWPTKKPDADNVMKSIADALNGIVYHDDKQIVRWSGWKKYSETPCVDVDVIEL